METMLPILKGKRKIKVIAEDQKNGTECDQSFDQLSISFVGTIP